MGRTRSRSREHSHGRHRTSPLNDGAAHALAHDAGNKRRRLIDGKRRPTQLAQPRRRKRVRHAGNARAINANLTQSLAMREYLSRRIVEYQFSLVERHNATAVFRKQRNLLLDNHHGDAGRSVYFAQRFEHKR